MFLCFVSYLFRNIHRIIIIAIVSWFITHSLAADIFGVMPS
jgi:hypothetical protein